MYSFLANHEVFAHWLQLQHESSPYSQTKWAICTMASFYYYDRNPSGYCFLVQIKAFVNKTSLGLPNFNMKGKPK